MSSHLWCGSRICQARNAVNTVTREYYAEGEYVPGTPAQPYYYGIDQLGTARGAFTGTIAPTFCLSSVWECPPVGDTGDRVQLCRMFYNEDSGLYLTKCRAYDPSVGR